MLRRHIISVFNWPTRSCIEVSDVYYKRPMLSWRGVLWQELFLVLTSATTEYVLYAFTILSDSGYRSVALLVFITNL